VARAKGDLMGKHHIVLSTDNTPRAEFIHKIFFHSIRNKVLQKSVLVYYNFFYETEGENGKRLKERLSQRRLPWNKGNVAYSLLPEDIMQVLSCSERTAKEYIDFFRAVMQ
jgi:hypothetical protein